MVTPVFYTQVQGAGIVLGVEPALASWDSARSLGQVRSAAFIDEVHRAVAEPIRATPGPLALRLDVGIAGSVPLHTAHDLDNYLFPLVPKLTARTGRDFVCVWATKRHAATSSIRVATAVPAEDPGGACVFEVRTTASASTAAYKKQIRDQVAATEPLPGGGVALQLAFVVGPRRAWPNLWKATIDALGAVLGRDDGAREWNARDGRVTDLRLHCTVNPAAGNEITIAVRASPASETRAA